ncbi:hypothetical protein tooticki91_gp008 [Flavobacterium phage vB_FspS_tooticki9-1]|uniref:Uncharacterized protein n=25 Tax=Caudoviricetes TaxID=2731619 RepID=A0A6B9LNW5_9CAUD|nr:hypothetical protein HWC87_gp14 [Flavobacterium phage vB_FspS_filifjonk9-1]YP_009854666.1 hypothetical protein HWC88_gp14 [Flavobacterium phage vB_FspS_hattifnatt9-1]YP_009854875.1 hypothetical protein HWC91_gp20 [Flavobacterium phage vB_FspS_lillamy9-1]YP_009855011.1 hypothetical protein HWC93_gp10 [Flavobacterium phage vB_FspS_mumin9-1]YP_009855079.1 hypothetical protein HWC94_gp11 [Flavobacterium phage vB_FspS_mymlan6-1]YP_009855158.1 hypothetical protein HWC95_gp22 [Flavobacterium phage
MENLKKMIKIRIETNEECIDNFNLSNDHKESLESENEFLNFILKELCKDNQ